MIKDREKICILEFDCVIKKSLVNEIKYRMRSRNNQKAHVISFTDLGSAELEKISAKDTYPSEQFQKVITSQRFDAVIHDELLYEALKKLKPDILDIVLLKFWTNLTDKEIGTMLDMSQQKVNYRKNSALTKLKKYYNGDDKK